MMATRTLCSWSFCRPRRTCPTSIGSSTRNLIGSNAIPQRAWTAALSNSPNPLDCETKQIVTNERDSATTYVTRTWGWQGTQLVVIKEIVSELRTNGQKRVTVRERRDGALRVTSQSIQ